jgi:hypothetical protein
MTKPLKTKALTNPKILARMDKDFNPYYLIFDRDNADEAYFCFERTVKEG